MPEAPSHELSAYALPDMPLLPLRPASRSRPWMAATSRGFAHRCLPLRAANESGWLIHTSHALTVEWNGDPEPRGVTLDWGSASPPYPAVSHFGHGIVTFIVPYLFRTPPGMSLWVRGPVNYPKDGIYALEGLVETDWAVATFTMNWKLTCAGLPAVFDADEPICMVVPHWRGLAATVQPRLLRLEDDEELLADYLAWSSQRVQFLGDLAQPDTEAARAGWERDYMLGRLPNGRRGREAPASCRPREFIVSQDIRDARNRPHD